MMVCTKKMLIFKMNSYTFRGNRSAIFIFVSLFNKGHLLTLLHSERPKLYTILAFLSAIGSKEGILPFQGGGGGGGGLVM